MVTEIRRVAATGCATASRQVLIADDDPRCLIALEKAFGIRGFRTVACADGRAAWKTIQERPGFFIAVLNWLLPDMDGHVICRNLHEQRSPMARVLMIGESFSGEAWKALRLHADYVLTKPFPAAGIGRQVDAIIRSALWRQGTAVTLYASRDLGMAQSVCSL